MNSPGGDVHNYVKRKAQRVKLYASIQAPKRTGALVAGLRIDVRKRSSNSVIGYVRSTARHSRWVHEGTTGPIYAKRGKYLRVPAYPGATLKVKRRSVRGQRAQPFLANALNQVMG